MSALPENNAFHFGFTTHTGATRCESWLHVRAEFCNADVSAGVVRSQPNAAGATPSRVFPSMYNPSGLSHLPYPAGHCSVSSSSVYTDELPDYYDANHTSTMYDDWPASSTRGGASSSWACNSGSLKELPTIAARSAPNYAYQSMSRSQPALCAPQNSAQCNINNKATHKCQLCGNQFDNVRSLRSHQKCHAELNARFQCVVCLKNFSHASNLNTHLRIHSGERPFQCPVCGRSFTQSSSVTTHLRVHSGERPYECEVCCRGFSDSSTLTKHLRIHTGHRPYQCATCGVRFTQSGNLNRHLKVHQKRSQTS